MFRKKTKFDEGRYAKGYIYFVQDKMTGLVKIGHTEQLERRLRNLANQLPSDIEVLHVIEVRERLRAERSFQGYFVDKNIKSEWYKLSQEDIQYLQAGYYPPVAKECLIAEYCPSIINLLLKARRKKANKMVHKKTKFVEEKYTKGHIYFVRDEATGLVKIGHTKQLERRLRNLANQLPGNIELLHVIEVEKRYTVERTFQHFFAHKNVRSEWYDLSQEDIECLQAGNYPSVAKEYVIAEYCPSEVNISLKTEKRAL